MSGRANGEEGDSCCCCVLGRPVGLSIRHGRGEAGRAAYPPAQESQPLFSLAQVKGSGRPKEHRRAGEEESERPHVVFRSFHNVARRRRSTPGRSKLCSSGSPGSHVAVIGRAELGHE